MAPVSIYAREAVNDGYDPIDGLNKCVKIVDFESCGIVVSSEVKEAFLIRSKTVCGNGFQRGRKRFRI
jgi:hypothetical protein